MEVGIEIGTGIEIGIGIGKRFPYRKINSVYRINVTLPCASLKMARFVCVHRISEAKINSTPWIRVANHSQPIYPDIRNYFSVLNILLNDIMLRIKDGAVFW